MAKMSTQAERVVVPVDEMGNTMSAPMVPVQRVQSQYVTAMAVQRPRDLVAIEKRAVQEAALLGESAFYAWGKTGNDRVEGPSKGLANALMRIYGNCAVDMLPVQETADAWIFTAAAIDVETGFTLTRQFRQAKRWTVHGRFDEERKADMRFQIGQSKAVRNVILNFLPEWLIERGIDAAKGGVREKIERFISKAGMNGAQDYAVTRLGELGVEEPRLLAAFGRMARAALTVEDLVIIAGNIKALETGSDSIEAMFPLKEEEKQPDTVANPFGNGGKSADLAARLKKQAEPAETVAKAIEERREEVFGNAAAKEPPPGEDISDAIDDEPPRGKRGKRASDMSGDDFLQSLKT